MEPTCAFDPRPGCQAVVVSASAAAEAVAPRDPGSRPEEYASRTPVAAVGVRPTKRSISSSGIRADRPADPDNANVRAVGSVNWRVMVVSGSLRGGNCEVRCRVITTVSRFAAEDAPSVESI